MKNVTMKVVGSTLTITIDLSKTFGESRSGKTTIVATTQGNVPVPEGKGAILGLNVYK